VHPLAQDRSDHRYVRFSARDVWRAQLSRSHGWPDGSRREEAITRNRTRYPPQYSRTARQSFYARKLKSRSCRLETAKLPRECLAASDLQTASMEILLSVAFGKFFLLSSMSLLRSDGNIAAGLSAGFRPARAARRRRGKLPVTCRSRQHAEMAIAVPTTPRLRGRREAPAASGATGPFPPGPGLVARRDGVRRDAVDCHGAGHVELRDARGAVPRAGTCRNTGVEANNDLLLRTIVPDGVRVWLVCWRDCEAWRVRVVATRGRSHDAAVRVSECAGG